MKNKLIIFIIICVLVLGGFLTYYFLRSGNNTVDNNDNTSNDETSNVEVNESDREQILKKGDIAYEDEEYKVYRGPAFQFGDTLLVYDKINDRFVNDDEFFTVDELITAFKKINGDYYTFGPNYAKKTVQIYNVTKKQLVRSFEGLNITFDNDLVIIDPGFPVLPFYESVWSDTLEELSVYSSQNKNRYNSDGTISVQNDNTIFLLDTNGKVLMQKTFTEVLDVYVDFIYVAKDENYSVYDHHFNLVKEIPIEEIENIDTIIVELQEKKG